MQPRKPSGERSYLHIMFLVLVNWSRQYLHGGATKTGTERNCSNSYDCKTFAMLSSSGVGKSSRYLYTRTFSNRQSFILDLTVNHVFNKSVSLPDAVRHPNAEVAHDLLQIIIWNSPDADSG